MTDWKKYEISEKRENGYYRIQALQDIPRHGVKKGDWGGFVSHPSNLSHMDDAWIAENARVLDEDCRVMGNALITDNARLFEATVVAGEAVISGNANLHNCFIEGTKTLVSGDVRLTEVNSYGKNITIKDRVRLRMVDISENCEHVVFADDATVDNTTNLLEIDGKYIQIIDRARVFHIGNIHANEVCIADDAYLCDGVTLRGAELSFTGFAQASGRMVLFSGVKMGEMAKLSYDKMDKIVLTDFALQGELDLTAEELQSLVETK